MRVRNKTQFINAVRRFEISTPWVVIKPNWVSNNKGEYTEPEILDWLLSALEGEQKIVVKVIHLGGDLSSKNRIQ